MGGCSSKPATQPPKQPPRAAHGQDSKSQGTGKTAQSKERPQTKERAADGGSADLHGPDGDHESPAPSRTAKGAQSQSRQVGEAPEGSITKVEEEEVVSRIEEAIREEARGATDPLPERPGIPTATEQTHTAGLDEDISQMSAPGRSAMEDCDMPPGDYTSGVPYHLTPETDYSVNVNQQRMQATCVDQPRHGLAKEGRQMVVCDMTLIDVTAKKLSLKCGCDIGEEHEENLCAICQMMDLSDAPLLV